MSRENKKRGTIIEKLCKRLEICVVIILEDC